MALAATLVGFGLLVVALLTGTLWLAVACIAVCVAGGLFLLADILGLGRALPWVSDLTAEWSSSDRSEELDAEVDADGSVPDATVATRPHRHVRDENRDSRDDPGSETPSSTTAHGRHESPDVAPDSERTLRHGGTGRARAVGSPDASP